MMMDTRRWILVEAWLALGLRVEWIPSFNVDRVERNEWAEDEETRLWYSYDGHGIWQVRHDGRAGRVPGFPYNTAPVLGLDALRHELAHYLSATVEEREKRNFGASFQALADPADVEQRALNAEKIIDAMMVACARIADMALSGVQARRP